MNVMSGFLFSGCPVVEIKRDAEKIPGLPEDFTYRVEYQPNEEHSQKCLAKVKLHWTLRRDG